MDCFKDERARFMFQTAAQRFQVIEDITKPIIIPFNEEARRLIEQLKNSEFPKSVLRKLQPYTVSIYESEFNNLSAKGVIITIAEYYPVLEQSAFETYYDPQRGLILPESTGGEELFF
jgi:CRISPR-associated endonuclease/helicase Cas3